MALTHTPTHNKNLILRPLRNQNLFLIDRLPSGCICHIWPLPWKPSFYFWHKYISLLWLLHHGPTWFKQRPCCSCRSAWACAPEPCKKEGRERERCRDTWGKWLALGVTCSAMHCWSCETCSNYTSLKKADPLSWSQSVSCICAFLQYETKTQLLRSFMMFWLFCFCGCVLAELNNAVLFAGCRLPGILGQNAEGEVTNVACKHWHINVSLLTFLYTWACMYV